VTTDDPRQLRLLWVEDDRLGVMPFIEALVQRGVHVDWAGNIDDAADLVERNSYGLVVIDLRLGDRPSGLRLLNQLAAIAPARRPRMAVVSAHIAQRSMREGLARTSVPVALIPKFLDTDDDETIVDVVVRRLLDVVEIEDAALETPARQFESIEENLRDPLRVHLQTFDALDPVEQRFLRERADRLLLPIANRFFREQGARWVVYCGTRSRPIKYGLVSDPLPDRASLRNWAEDAERPVFCYTAPQQLGTSKVEEVKSTSSSGGSFNDPGPSVALRLRCPGRLADYPTLVLSFDGGDEAEDTLRVLHFDTGADFHVVRHEDLVDFSLAKDPNISWAEPGPLGDDLPFSWYELEEDLVALLRRQVEGGVQEHGRAITLTDVRVVVEWDYSPYVRYCDEPSGCGAPPSDALPVETEHGLELLVCPVRSGIVGRRLLADNQLDITIAASSEVTRTKRPRRRPESESE